MGAGADPGLVVPGRLELPTSTLSVWRSNQLSYRTPEHGRTGGSGPSERKLPVFTPMDLHRRSSGSRQDPKDIHTTDHQQSEGPSQEHLLQKGGVPAAPSGTATLLRLSPNHLFHPRPTLAVTDFRRSRLSWLDGRCVQGPGTYSPRHG